MKWMGWSWRDYQVAPLDVVEKVIELIIEEQKQFEEMKARHR